MFCLTRAFLIAVFLCGAPVASPVAADGPAPFRQFEAVPDDVSLYVHVRDAAALRAELRDRPIARWVSMLLEQGTVKRAWSELARTAGIDAGTLFDLSFGREATFIRRGSAERGEWLVITELRKDDADAVIGKLRPRILPPRHGAVMLELPEHQLLLARDDERLLVAPRAQPGLLHDMLTTGAADDHGGLPDGAASTDRPGAEVLRTLGCGRVGVIVRHDPPLGGWSAAVASLEGRKLAIRHRASFRNAPFTRDLTQLEIDIAPLEHFEHHALAAVIEPTDVAGGPLETYIVARLGANLLSSQMRRNLGHRSILVLGEIEGRQEPDPVDIQAPTFAVCIELRNPEQATRQLDEHMLRLCRRINALGEGRFTLELPEFQGNRGEVHRQIDLAPASEWLTGGLPIAQPISLNWSVADGPLGRYYVIASHPAELRQTLAVLQTDRPPLRAKVGRYQGSGTASGIRIANHLRSWSDQPTLFADGPQQVEFQRMMRLMSELAAGMSRIRWQFARPTRNSVELDVTIELSPPESARPE